MRQQFPQHEMLQYEKELLGFYVSGHPLDDYQGIAEALTNFNIKKVDDLGDRVDFQICGIATGVTKKLSRKDNRPWAFFNIQTLQGSVSLNCYADGYEECGHNLENEKLLLVKGNVFRNAEGVRLVVQEALPLESQASTQVKHITWILDPEKDTDSFFYDYRAALDKTHGDIESDIAFKISEDQIVTAPTASSLRWRFNPEEWKAFKNHPAVVGCLIQTNPVEVKERKRRWAKKG